MPICLNVLAEPNRTYYHGNSKAIRCFLSHVFVRVKTGIGPLSHLMTYCMPREGIHCLHFILVISRAQVVQSTPNLDKHHGYP